MRARDIVGKTVARVVQRRVTTNTGPEYHIDEIVFTDGTRLFFFVAETENAFEQACATGNEEYLDAESAEECLGESETFASIRDTELKTAYREAYLATWSAEVSS